MNKKVIEEKITNLLYQHGYDPKKDSYIDAVRFVRQEGFSVGNAFLSEDEDGFLVIRPNKSKVIGVNSSLAIEQKRFAVAHEFAHFVLHYENKQFVLHHETQKRKNKKEKEADYFARALLMPLQSFKRRYNQLQASKLSESIVCMSLAKVYKTSMENAFQNIVCWNLAMIYRVPIEQASKRMSEIDTDFHLLQDFQDAAKLK